MQRIGAIHRTSDFLDVTARVPVAGVLSQRGRFDLEWCAQGAILVGVRATD